jgi:hypothetical protein
MPNTKRQPFAAESDARSRSAAGAGAIHWTLPAMRILPVDSH